MNQELWQAICELYWLLRTGSQVESDYQDFFENNPDVFPILGFRNSASFERKSGNRLPYDEENNRQLEPDFICGDPLSQRVTVFELKTPVGQDALVSLANGSRKKFKAVIETYLSQVAEYCEFISENSDARSVVSEKLGLGGVKGVDGLLVYGTTDDEQAPLIYKLTSRRNPPITILHYDSVLEALLKAYAIGRKDILFADATGNIPTINGFAFLFHVVVNPKQTNSKAYLVDAGSLDRNRLSLYIEDGKGVVQILDSRGRQFTSEWNFSFNCPLQIRVESSSQEGHRFISVFVNNVEVDLWQSAGGAEAEPDFSNFFVGSDLRGENGSCFKMLESAFVGRTLNWFERVDACEYFQQKAETQTGCLEFDGGSFMYRDERGLLQDVAELRPTYRESIDY